MPVEVTYPPVDVPKPVAAGVWVVDSGPQRVLGLPIPLRMVVLRLEDGGLWLHSPTRFSPALAAALTALGPVRHLVSPGTAHWMHLQAWQAALFPTGFSGMSRIRTGAYREHAEPMQIISSKVTAATCS